MEQLVRIYFKDTDCAVVYKTAGEDSQTFYTPLFSNCPFVQPVHRLDKPVSGLLLVAFSPKIQAVLTAAFSNRLIQKEYWAVCERTSPEVPPLGLSRCIEHWLSFNKKRQKAFVCTDETAPAAKKASLEWICCGHGERYDFMHIFPETGRTHQIRIQMAAIGHPIKGDLKYGARRSEKNGGIRLHSYRMSFPHPVTQKPITVTAAPQQPDNLWTACIAACTASHTRQAT